MTSTGDLPGAAESHLDPVVLDGLWDFDNPVLSERRFREALIARDEVVGRESTPESTSEALVGQALAGDAGGVLRAELTTQLARAVGMQGRFDEAGALLDGIGDVDCLIPVVHIRLALERGRLLNSSGDPVGATEQFLDALAAAQGAGEDFLEVDAAHMLAITDHPRADEWTAQALRTVSRSADPRTRRWAGSLHNNAGWARHDAGDYSAALTEFEAALAAYSVDGTVEQIRVARWAVARALRSLARFDEALQIQRRLAALGPADGYVEEELAELLLATGDRSGAGQHAAAAVDLLAADGWFAEYESGRLDRLRELASSADRA